MMLFWQFTLRHLIRHWRLSLAVMVVFTVSAAFLAGLPTYAEMIAARSLEQALQGAPAAGRNIEITSPSATMSDALTGSIRDDLGGLVAGYVEVQNVKVNILPPVPGPTDAAKIVNPQIVWAWSFDRLSELTHLIAGTWPTYPEKPRTPRDLLKPPRLEAVIDDHVAHQTGYGIGDVLSASDGTLFTIVGIVQRVNPLDDIWWGDNTPFELTIQPGTNEDTFIMPVIVTPRTLKDYLPVESGAWRIVLKQDEVNVNNLQVIEDGFINLKIRAEANHANLASGLPNLLVKYRQDLATIRMVLYMLSLQAYLFVLYTLFLLSSLFIVQSRGELATLTGRGANEIQITASFSTGVFILALPTGLILGIGLVRIILAIWSSINREPVPGSLSSSALLLACSAVLSGWVAFTIPIYPAARRNLLDFQQRITRPEQSTIWQRFNLDLFLLVFSLLIYWQLITRNSFVLNQLGDTPLADPLLLAGPSILLISIALILLRLFPYFLMGLAWLSRNSRGFVMPFGLTRLSRDPVYPCHVVLLISLAAGLTLFARTFSDTLDINQWESAHYQTGADLRINLHNQSMDNLVKQPGIYASSTVFRGVVQRSGGQRITILAVDPETFPSVTSYPPGLSNLTMQQLAEVLRSQPQHVEATKQTNNPYLPNPYLATPTSKQPIPAIVSYAMLRNDEHIGDQIEASISGIPFDFIIRGIISDFPTVSGLYLLVSSSALQATTGPQFIHLFQHSEAWLSVRDNEYPAFISKADLASSILGDARQALHSIQSNALTLGAMQAFRLNGFILAGLSVIGFLVVTYFSTRQRSYEFSLLRAQGSSPGQLFRLLALEGTLVLVFGLLIGTGLGYGLALGMQPFLNQAIARQLPGMRIQHLTFNWLELARIYAGLIAFYAITLLLLLTLLLRSGIHRVLRTSEE